MSVRPGYIHRFQKWWHSPLAKIALVLGVVVHLAGFLAFRVVIEPPPAHAAVAPFIQWNGNATLPQDVIRGELALLMDSEAIFLPTAFNVRSSSAELRHAMPGQSLLAADEKTTAFDINWSEENLILANGKAMTVFKVLRRYAQDSLGSFGQQPQAEPAQPLVFAEVRQMDSGQTLGSFPLEMNEANPGTPAGPGLLEFILYRTSAGNVGSLLPLSPSARETTGQAWAGFLQRADWVNALPEGYYRITVSE